MTHLDFLRNVSLFESLDQQELKALSDVTFTRTFSKDNVIILAEEEGDTLFILKKGKVKVSIVSEGGREVILSLLGPGSVFGELSLLDGKPRSANVVAIEETDLLMLRRVDFLQLIYKTPQIATAPPVSKANRQRRPNSCAPARPTRIVQITPTSAISPGPRPISSSTLIRAPSNATPICSTALEANPMP